MKKHVGLDEKLSALQEADPLRHWYSLDDKRVCVLCDRVISGRMIDIWQDKRGVYRLHCPTASCSSSPRDWFYHRATKAPRGKVVRSRAPVGFGFAPA